MLFRRQGTAHARSSRRLTAGALVLAVATALYGDEKPPAPPGAGTTPPAVPSAQTPDTHEPATVGSFFTEDVVEAFRKGKLNFNARLRYEYADQQTLDPSNAYTVRPRLGFTTSPLYGFQGMLEFEHVQVLGDTDHYNQAGLNPGGAGKTVVADPEGPELNQAWLGYNRWDTTIKGGRQQLNLDNTRFVGDVGWRQNNQTFDLVGVQNKSIKDVSLYYGYLWNVNRVFGDDHPLGDYRSDSHLINASWAMCPQAKLVGYSYLLNFDDPTDPVVQNSSSATYGASLAGSVPVDKERSAAIQYRAEFAWQTDYQSSLVDYGTEYYNVEAGGTFEIFSAGAGLEVLGSDNNQGFRTPLATLHAFNGWADVFLNTPAAGLRDIYAFAGVKLPGNVPLKVIYHKFNADEGSGDFGQEVDVVASRAFGKHWTLLLKYAFYDAEDPSAPAQAVPSDVQKFWAQVEFNY